MLTLSQLYVNHVMLELAKSPCLIAETNGVVDLGVPLIARLSVATSL